MIVTSTDSQLIQRIETILPGGRPVMGIQSTRSEKTALPRKGAMLSNSNNKIIVWLAVL